MDDVYWEDSLDLIATESQIHDVIKKYRFVTYGVDGQQFGWLPGHIKGAMSILHDSFANDGHVEIHIYPAALGLSVKVQAIRHIVHWGKENAPSAEDLAKGFIAALKAGGMEWAIPRPASTAPLREWSIHRHKVIKAKQRPLTHREVAEITHKEEESARNDYSRYLKEIGESEEEL